MLTIGIDPDVDKSGVATLDSATGELRLACMAFPVLTDYLRGNTEARVYIEAGWLERAHHHVGWGDSGALAARKGNAVGRNHEVGRLIAEMCAHYGIRHECVRPLRKMWRGRDRKITHEEFCRVTGYKSGRTNQEERDAGLIAWEYAGMPMRV